MIRRIKIRFTIVMLRILFFIYDRMVQSDSNHRVKFLICDRLCIRFSLNHQDLKFNYKNIIIIMIMIVKIC